MKAVFLDRDGTIVVEKGYITIPDDIELIPGAAEAIVRLRAGGWKVFVATNQGCVGKGMISEDELGEINYRMVSMLGAEGAQLDGIYVCPHHPNGTVADYTMECDCRKPRPGMLERAASENGLDLSQCVMIGDTMRDVGAARSAGARAILVRTGHGVETASQDHGAEHVAADLAAAVHWLLNGAIK